MVIHSFGTSASKGEVGESILKNFFEGKGYTVVDATLIEEKEEGFDFTVSKESSSYKVEVKTEYSSERTGNLFWEMEVDGKPGWTQKYKEDSPVLICILQPISRKLYIFSAKSLRRMTTFVEEEFPSSKRIVTNKRYEGTSKEETYLAWGYLFPIHLLPKFSKTYTI